MQFYKYHGTGNDFIMIDNRSLTFPKGDVAYIAELCHRRYGIGADGLILLEEHDTLDFRMVYFNADGREGSMCGNGGRCIVAFAKQLGVIKAHAQFEAVDGLHEADIDEANLVSLKMNNVESIEQVDENAFFLDTGSPHYISIVSKMPQDDFVEQAKAIRYSDRFKKEGVNVNFIEILKNNNIAIRTYERGVEDETYSCGTGAVAAALVMMQVSGVGEIDLNTKGGDLSVSAIQDAADFSEIYLKGKVTFVFSGQF